MFCYETAYSVDQQKWGFRETKIPECKNVSLLIRKSHFNLA